MDCVPNFKCIASSIQKLCWQQKCFNIITLLLWRCAIKTVMILVIHSTSDEHFKIVRQRLWTKSDQLWPPDSYVPKTCCILICLRFADKNCTTTTILRPFFRHNHPCELVPEENFRCKGRLTEADTLIVWMGTTPSGLTSAHLHHPPFFTGRMPFLLPNQQR